MAFQPDLERPAVHVRTAEGGRTPAQAGWHFGDNRTLAGFPGDRTVGQKVLLCAGRAEGAVRDGFGHQDQGLWDLGPQGLQEADQVLIFRFWVTLIGAQGSLR